MKKVSIDVWIQLLGMIGIIISLVFVALQMRQSQQIAVVGQQQARANMYVDRYLTFIGGADHLKNRLNQYQYKVTTI